MAEYGSTWERTDLGGGQFEHVQHLKPITYFRDGLFRPMVNDYINDGLGGHAIVDSPLMVTIGDDANGRATRQLHPTGELDVWASIGRPYNVTTREPYPLNPFVRSGNLLTSTNTLADVMIWHGGHFSKLGIRLKGAWRTSPPEQFAFPVGLQGLTWEGDGVIAKNGVPVMRLTAPVMYDMANPDLRRAIPWDFIQIAGQWYVVFDTPSTAGMTAPLIDPTLELQPDATAGIDTAIDGINANQNYGASETLYCGSRNDAPSIRYRILLRMDYSALPDSAAILSDTLSLFAHTDVSSNARTYRVFRSKRLWVEGTSALGSGATWNTYDGVNNWQTAGGFGANDCEQTDIGSRVFTATETLNQFKDFALTPTTKGALDLGNGRMIKADTESSDGYWFYSSDRANASQRPKEVIVYTEASGALLKQMLLHNQFAGGTL